MGIGRIIGLAIGRRVFFLLLLAAEAGSWLRMGAGRSSLRCSRLQDADRSFSGGPGLNPERVLVGSGKKTESEGAIDTEAGD